MRETEYPAASVEGFTLGMLLATTTVATHGSVHLTTVSRP